MQGMYFFYVDEAGSPEGHHEPLMEGETPIFTLNCMSIKEDNWRRLDRDYVYLKRRFFAKEINTRRAEFYEIKGHTLVSPHQRTSKRRHAFIREVFSLCRTYDARCFSVVFIKDPGNPTSKRSLYTMALQYLVERFQIFLEELPQRENGVIIIDSRVHNLDTAVAVSHLSFIFGHQTGITCDRILEAPLFADSQLTVGLQVTDIIGSCIYANYYLRNCMFISGKLDYSHMAYCWPYLSALEFRSTRLYGGYIKSGYRVIDFHSAH
jgi:hypothetical protein